jgi:arylsulfatase A
MKYVSILLLHLIVTSTLTAGKNPNVLVIYTDDQGYGDASCLNPQSKFTTPALDRLASEGMSFTDAHSSDTVCTPSRYGLLTGRYAWRTRLKTGVLGAEIPCLIEDGRMTLATLLKDKGYDTAMIGKWHLGMDFPGDRKERDWSQPTTDMPLDKGFGYFYGIPASLNYGVLAWFEGRHAKVPPTLYTSKKPNEIAISDYRIKPPYDPATENIRLPNEKGLIRGALEVAPDFVDSACLTRFTDKTIEWLAEKRDPSKPFFIYLPFTSPHKPVIPIDQFRGKSKAGAYGDFMIETDWHIGRILDWLDKNDLAENTLVIFSSDNGPENTWPDRLEKFGHASNLNYREGKRSIYEGGHRVPFLIRWPEKVKPGSQYNGPVCQTDLLATIAQIVGQDLPDKAGEDSVSFYDVLTTGKAKNQRVPMIHHGVQGRFAIREGNWKLVMESDNTKIEEKRELYRLDRDPSEEKSILDQHPDIEAKMLKALQRIVKSGRSAAGGSSGNDTGWWDKLIWMEKW